MKIRILYRPNSDHARNVEDFAREFTRRTNAVVEYMNVDTREGWSEASLYGVMSYPAVLVLQEDGGLLMSWEGGQLPLMDELAAYARS